ncbi:WbqC family protein [Uliginosibacterium sp. H3]|uniref:WbqC family protein n=1 Tax=Uliginosibacterium silvisoli TaxID=3114758 RepID=A0ABU6K1Q6_9RHOO|nr:WbqC family protein [Uliginosibacterium sp. H3]
MKLAIMQPYFLPYIGYFQLIGAVDEFVVYDNIKYTKKGWINRNRFLLNGSDATFSLPLKNDSDTLDVVQRELAVSFNREKLLNQFRGAYASAPYFAQNFAFLERVVRCEERNLFCYIQHSILETCKHLGLKTRICISSEIPVDHDLKAQDKVLALCLARGADTYINSIGGIELYSPSVFRTQGIALNFLRPKPFVYSQFGAPFVPWLSIVDVLMFNPIETVAAYISGNYDLI